MRGSRLLKLLATLMLATAFLVWCDVVFLGHKTILHRLISGVSVGLFGRLWRSETIWGPRTDPTQRALAGATGAFDVLAFLVPSRINDEELGDARERIATMVAAGRAPWRVYVLIATTVFWALVHAAHTAVRGAPQRKSK